MSEVPRDWSVVDIGPATVAAYTEHLTKARTIFWNGPMGIFEIAPFAEGTNAIARFLAERTAKGVVTVVGGGDRVAAVEQLGLADQMTHVSTGGGASLEFVEGKTLPGVAALRADARWRTTMTTLIEDIVAREVLDSRGNPTIEVEVFLEGGAVGTPSCRPAPRPGPTRRWSCATGTPQRYGGKGVLQAVRNVNDTMRAELVGSTPWSR